MGGGEGIYGAVLFQEAELAGFVADGQGKVVPGAFAVVGKMVNTGVNSGFCYKSWKLGQKNIKINTPAAGCGVVGCARNFYCMQKYPPAFAGGYFCFAIRW